MYEYLMEMQFVFCEVESGLVSVWWVKVKINLSLEHSMRTQRRVSGIALLFL